MILIIDNYDSFTYNLVHLVAESVAETIVQNETSPAPELEVHRNDKITLEEIRARRGPVIAITHSEAADRRISEGADAVIEVPRSEPVLDPLLLNLPLQLLAYHTAVALERDVDQPRNLAKSVTVE